MTPNKQNRINDEVQIALSGILRSIKDPRINQGMISVTHVDVAGDLRTAKVWLSVYGLQNEKDFLKGLKSAAGWIRRELSAAVKLRQTPQLTFVLDHSIEQGAHINSLLSALPDIQQTTQQTEEDDDEQ